MNPETPESAETTTPGTEAAAVNASPIHLKSILVPLDFSERSLKSLQYAVPLAKQFGAKLTLLHVLKAPIHKVDFAYLTSLGHQKLTVIEKKLEDMIPPDVAVETTVRQNVVLEAILEVAHEIEADLIITMTHGHTGMEHLIKGSTAESVVRRAPCPVLVLHDQEHDFVDPLPA